jgi:CPA2 family monovalent cation:H+ antiporter-2
MTKNCGHLDLIRPVTARTAGCEECLKSGDSWVHLRLCLTCGHVGCCDDSKNHHARQHAEHSKHPLMQSYEPGERWFYCFIDKVTMESDDLPSLRRNKT